MLRALDRKVLPTEAVMKITPLDKGTPMARVLHVQITDRYDLAMTFLRMQEWYESPKFHHRSFTIEQFMRWYSKEYGKGSFTYPKDWSGFNVPSEAALAVLNTMSSMLCSEWFLFDRLITLGYIVEPDPTRRGASWDKYLAPKPFYLIGTHASASAADLPHEVAHGAFYVYPERRREVLRVLRRYDTAPLANFLLKLGYSKWTLKDEIQAYALTGWPEGFKATPPLTALRKELRSVVGVPRLPGRRATVGR